MPNFTNSRKAATVIKEIVDERGRYIRPAEFGWLLEQFDDRYDPKRLIIAICYTVGLRLHDAVRVRFDNFNDDFSYLRMRQCKAHITKKDGVTRVTVKPKNHPLPTWLSNDLKAFVTYRLAVGKYCRYDKPGRLFPTMQKRLIYMFFYRLRLKKGDEQPWLKDVWYVEHRLDVEGNLICSRKVHRVAPHMGRAMHAVAAKTVCKGDLAAARLITGHDETKDIERYTRFADVEVLKQELTDRFMQPLVSSQPTPLLAGQRSLKVFG